ncbi:hypothetical protein SAMN05444383_101327 [Myxococcus xanthus]|nr:hypothetical protein SAMN05444383_101327 [Myxococcus xanthus]
MDESTRIASFQLTLPAFTRSDQLPGWPKPSDVEFQPTLPAFTRSDHVGGLKSLCWGVSTHAPRVHEERLRATGTGLPWDGFNPRSPRSRGATIVLFPLSCSIRFQPTLPAFTRSDFARQVVGVGSDGFQPTLPAFTRSDELGARLHRQIAFQPTLPAFTRSDHHEGPAAHLLSVSTHAPRVHEERRTAAPRPASWGGFNPRSPRSRGATIVLFPLSCSIKFQPTLPAFTRSDARTGPPQPTARSFNPRSPRSRGATPPRSPSPTTSMFQPTLPAFTRSDRRGARPGHPLGAVSTHAPRVHEERPREPPRCYDSRGVSTHAPRVHEERPAARQPRRRRCSFNPRSPRSRGATRGQMGCR